MNSLNFTTDMIQLREWNQNKITPCEYPKAHKSVLNLAAFKKAETAIKNWKGYHPTPIHRLSSLESELGINQIWYKDESDRFGLNSFKALGGAYAVFNLIKNLFRREGTANDITDEDILAGKYRDFIKTVTVTSATDGNHGKSVAWGAQQVGCQCVIYIHSEVSEERKKAIEHYGAQVVRVDGNYDFSVAEAERNAKIHGRYVVSDTTYPGYTEIPKDVMQGYTIMVQEALDQIGDTIPTHIFIQAGVGGLPAAVIAHCWELYGKRLPKFIIVEPVNAACIYESVKAGKPVAVKGELDTIMAGLACGEVSPVAFAIIKDSVEYSIAVSEEAAKQVMRDCANGIYGKTIVCGESATGGLAGLILCGITNDTADKLELNKNAIVLVFGTEGATAPSIYESIVGKSAQEVANSD